MSYKNDRFLLLSLLVAALILGVACSNTRKVDINQTIRQNFTSPTSTPILLAAYQPWFGQPNHIRVGYNSQDPVVLQKQIAKAKNLGIEAFVVNWYGRRHQFEDHAYAAMQQTASENSFHSAIMYDEDTQDPENATGTVIEDLQYAYDHYIGPNAPTRDAYLRFNGRPMIFIFPKGSFTDWNRVREAVNGWDEQPLLIYKDIPPQRFLKDFDGLYAWVHVGQDSGEEYLKNFYLRMNNRFPDKLAVGAAWPGFDDHRASWSRGRRMDPRCGKTFDETLRMFRRYYTPEHPLPFLMIDTWNDYEEGTAIEPGLANCRGSSPQSAQGNE